MAGALRRSRGLLILAPWPEEKEPFFDPAAAEELSWLVRAISAIRTARSELNVPPSARLTLLQNGASPTTLARLARHREAFERLARIAAIDPEERPVPQRAILVVVDEATFAMPVGEVVDLERERARLERELEKTRAELDRLARRLADASFLARAPAEVVEENRERLSALARSRERLEAALARIA